MSKIKSRSESYQWMLLELSCAHEMLEAFSNEDSIQSRLNPWAYNEDVMELEEELKVEFWRVVNMLTPRQAEVIKLFCQGHTQQEIAKKLKVNQSSITKSLNGNVDYKSGRKCYGGSLRKIDKIIEGDTKIQELLAKIRELRSHKW